MDIFFKIIIFVATCILLLLISYQLDKKRHKERMKKKDEYIAATIKLSKTLDDSKIDLVEIENFKRWVGKLLDAIAEHTDKMDEFKESTEKVFTPSLTIDGNFDYDEMMENLKNGFISMEQPGEVTTVSEIIFKERLKIANIALQSQYRTVRGTGDWSFYNGMEFVLSIMEGRVPKYIRNDGNGQNT